MEKIIIIIYVVLMVLLTIVEISRMLYNIEEEKKQMLEV